MFHLIVRLQDLHNIQEKLLHLTTAIFSQYLDFGVT